MSIANAKALLAPLLPEGYQLEERDECLNVLKADGTPIGIGAVPDEDDKDLYLIAQVMLYSFAFGDVEEVDETMVLEMGAEALGLPEGLDCEVGIVVYDGRTNDDGTLIEVEEEGEVEVEAFELSFSPAPPLKELDTELLRNLIAGAPYILPEDD